MKHIEKKVKQLKNELEIPEGIKVNVKARLITVEGPRGVLEKSFRHLNIDIIKFKKPVTYKDEDENNVTVVKPFIKFVVHHGERKHNACRKTACSLVNNMIIGVTKGFQYKLRYVYAHFPINVIINDGGKAVEIRNFLGQKVAFQVSMRGDAVCEASKGQKDELLITGNSLDDVSQSAADIQQSCLVKNKDIRKFLDGIYVSERNTLEAAA